MNKKRIFFRMSIGLIVSLCITLAGGVALSSVLFKEYSEVLWAVASICLWPYLLLEEILNTGNISATGFWGMNVGGWMLLLFPVSFIRFRKSKTDPRDVESCPSCYPVKKEI